MKSRRELNVIRAKIARESEPVFDCAIGIGIPLVTRCQLLQRGSEDPHLHELWLK
jgi:hypothetical protein